jgi:hypothetical protein
MCRSRRRPEPRLPCLEVSEKEPFARTAGRYVRAAGVAISKELERRSADSEQRTLREEQDRRQAAAAAEARPEAPPHAPPATGKRGRARGTAVPALPEKPLVDGFLYYLFLVSLVAVALAGLQVQMLTDGTIRSGIRLGLGVILVLMALLLLWNWQQARRRLVTRFFRRIWGLEEATTRTGRFFRSVGGDVMTLIGIAWLALGVFELLRAFVDP